MKKAPYIIKFKTWKPQKYQSSFDDEKANKKKISSYPIHFTPRNILLLKVQGYTN
jgi:hypothetical protein